MSENTYEYECMRAELLGIEKPDYDEFLKNQKEAVKLEAQEEEIDLENMKEIESEVGSLRRTSGRLEELNNILKKTQTKINQLKTPFGSLMTRVSEKWGSQTSIDATKNSIEEDFKEHNVTEDSENPNNVSLPTTSTLTQGEEIKVVRKSDLAKALDSDLSKLDKMIDQAEKAQFSMAHQTRQMKTPFESLMTRVSEKWGSQTSIDATKNSIEEDFKEHNVTEDSENPNNESLPKTSTLTQGEEIKVVRKSDLAKALDSDLSKLHKMIDQAEKAQFSMAHQTRQMKVFLK